jgi:membrane carboxypeptidase/penicillin-binding protein
MPLSIRQAVVAAEDRRFYEHGGVSIGGIVRALTTDVGAGDAMQGGSTITQQYARNAFDQIGTARTVSRKLKEALLAVRLENQYSKEQILDDYLNTVYFGRGAYGIEAAAQAYFNVPARTLTIPQSAYLAGIIRGPEIYDRAPKAAKERRDQVLGVMYTLGDITARQLRTSRASPVALKKPIEPPVQAAYFVEYIRRLLRTPVSEGGFGLSDAEVVGGGLRVYTTLDLSMQEAAEDAVMKVLNRPDPGDGRRTKLHEHPCRTRLQLRDARGFRRWPGSWEHVQTIHARRFPPAGLLGAIDVQRAEQDHYPRPPLRRSGRSVAAVELQQRGIRPAHGHASNGEVCEHRLRADRLEGWPRCCVASRARRRDHEPS